MTAHVVPRAKPYPEKTEVDGGGWEDEASTTIEQGEAADRLKPLMGRTNGNLTQTGTGVEELTVDEGSIQANAQPARLLITAGNDAGREIEIAPTKTYTIGRGLDNDVVLTDIAVSRKHFDLKPEGGSWIVVDRGSGNGTVVNGNVEDNPFMLASGDVIEIGNTTFRFEQPNGVSRASQAAFDDVDDDMSTVAGKPMREADELPMAPPPEPLAPRNRPKTMPPPVPLRANSPTQPPIIPTLSPPTFAPALPAPMLASPAPLAAPPLGPSMLGAPPPMYGQPSGHHASPTMVGDAMGMPMVNGMPATLQGQGPGSMRPSAYPYAQVSDLPLHVQPAYPSPMHSMPSMSGYAPVQAPPRGRVIDKRTRLAIAGVALALTTGIVTAAIVKASKSKPAAVAKKEAAKPAAKPATPTVTPIEKPTATPIETPKVETPKAVAKVETPKVETPKVETLKAEAPKVEPPKVEVPKVEPVKETPKETPKRVARETPKRETPKREPAPTRVAAATDSSAARDRAESLYRDKKFSEAANVLAAAARSADSGDARELKDRANKLKALQSAYAKGTAPAGKSTDAFASLQQAINLDSSVGGNFRSELTEKLRAVAPKAAVSFAAAKDWSSARSAYIAAQNAGSSDPNLPLVKQKLEAYANDLYAQAQSEATSNPSSAKDKLKQIRQLVDAKSPIATKAQALYNKL